MSLETIVDVSINVFSALSLLASLMTTIVLDHAPNFDRYLRTKSYYKRLLSCLAAWVTISTVNMALSIISTTVLNLSGTIAVYVILFVLLLFGSAIVLGLHFIAKWLNEKYK